MTGGARRTLVLGAAAAALAAATPSPASAAGGVRVTVNGHPGPRLPPTLLEDNVDVRRDTPSTTRTADLRETRDGHGGTSAALLATLAGLDPAHVVTLAVERPGTRGSVVLTNAEIVGGFGGDPLGVREATFDPAYNDGSEVRFFRPLRMLATGLDVNEPDALDPPRNTDLLVDLTTDGPVLTVSAHADPAQAAAGTPVSFSAAVAPASLGTTFAWDFGDGDATTASDAVEHVYTTDGSYDAAVTAFTRDGGSGTALVHVRIGAPSGGTTGRAGGGHGSPQASSTGAARGGAVQATAHRGARGRKVARVQDQPSAPAATPSASTQTTSQAATPPSTARHAARRDGDGVQRSHTGSTGSARATVSGVLLTSTGSALAPTLAHVSLERRDAAARAAAPAARSLGWWLLGGLGLAALLGLGVARESGLRLTRRLRVA
ncbi:MAG TPA: PKD domain-containing protein [Conexibacter sp.]|nr:PKD domain-containing protein [Conexibacter sp.]